MKCWSFDIIIADLNGWSDDLLNAVFDAGLDDSTPYTVEGVTGLTVGREAETLTDAITSAVQQIRTAGLKVERVQLSEEHIDELAVTA